MAEVDFYPVPIVFFFFFVFNLSLSQESLAAGASTIQSEVASPWARANAKGPGSLIPVTPASPSQDPSTSPPIFSLPTSIPSHFGIIKTKLTFYAYFFNTTMDDDTLKAMEEFLLEFINLSFKEGLSAAKLKSFEVLTQIRTRNILEIKTMVTAYPIFKEMLISEANLKNTLILHITSTTFLHEIQKKIPFFKKTHIFSRDLKQIQTAFPSLVPTQPFMIFDENTRRNSTSNNHIIDSNITNIEKIVCIVMGCSIILFVAAGICVCKRCCQQKCSHIGGYGAFSFKELGSMQEGPSVDGMVNRTPLSLDPFERMTKKKKKVRQK
uniref:Uncharacterized protein n=1 Tax=Corethron hystrix TaxID=216773 RepID=A0A7S1FYF5_9STRA|mmetsp:Transcript_40331/g.94768  ORF Transcript_40331/g.94768 Transcript_40331/m.94768 type:complete len:324 (+) Transcript_40331:151-1122(+)